MDAFQIIKVNNINNDSFYSRCCRLVTSSRRAGAEQNVIPLVQ